MKLSFILLLLGAIIAVAFGKSLSSPKAIKTVSQTEAEEAEGEEAKENNDRLLLSATDFNPTKPKATQQHDLLNSNQNKNNKDVLSLIRPEDDQNNNKKSLNRDVRQYNVNVNNKMRGLRGRQRERRNYNRSWFIQSPAFNLEAPTAIYRPVIPAWTIRQKHPYYLTPHTVYFNPGYPQDNPPIPNRGYLPVPPPTIGNKFGEGDDDDDDRPVWGGGGNRLPPVVATTARPNFVPTRRPPPQGPTTFPPIIHGSNNRNNTSGNELAPERPQTTTTRRPQIQTTTRRPQPQTTQRPKETGSGSNAVDKGLSQCIWATVSCCSGVNADISYSCFEQLGCVGAFWDVNPCDSPFAKAAIEAALNYYN